MADAVERTNALTRALMGEPTKPALRRLIVGAVGSSVRLLRIFEEDMSSFMFRDRFWRRSTHGQPQMTPSSGAYARVLGRQIAGTL